MYFQSCLLKFYYFYNFHHQFSHSFLRILQKQEKSTSEITSSLKLLEKVITNNVIVYNHSAKQFFVSEAWPLA